jgi:tetratricopeptide (TPR) repeat protein
MKRLAVIFLLAVICQNALCQDLEALKKMQDSLQKVFKQFEKEMKGMQSAPAPKKANSKSLPMAVQDEDDKLPVPKKNSKLLAAIPAKTFTSAELVSYVTGLQTRLIQQKTNAGEITTAKSRLKKYPAASHHNLALLFFSKKQYVSSLYVLCEVVKNSPSNILAVNNLAAVLTHVGFPHKSIPVSKHVAATAAQSAMVNNNLGQAYFQLGDMDNAIRFLSAAIRIEPFHIEANATLGYINEAGGNSANAARQYSNSLKGGYNKAAAEGLKRSNPSDDPGNHLRLPPRMRYPEMDDNLPFSCPTDPGSDYAACELFNARMHAETEAWDKARQEYDEKAGGDMQANAMRLLNVQQSGARIGITMPPLFKKAQAVLAKSYQAYVDDLKRVENEFEKWRKEFDAEWGERLRQACNNLDPDACCITLRSLYNSKNAAYMNRYHRYCEDVWKNARWHYNTVAYWYPYVASVPLASRDLVLARGILLGTASKLSAVYVTAYTCDNATEQQATSSKKADFKNIDCPVSINIPLGVGDIKLSCESFSVDMGEGIMGGLEYEFSSGQTTMYIGVGAQAELGVVSFEASATQFISFDSDFNVTDIGNKVSAGASAMEISSTLGLNGASVQGEATFGVNSGLKVSADASVLGQSMMAGEIQLL